MTTQATHPVDAGTDSVPVDDIAVDVDANTGGLKQRWGDWLRQRADIQKARLAGSATARSKPVAVASSVKGVDGCLFYGEDGYWHVSLILSTIALYNSKTEVEQYNFQLQLANVLRQLEGRYGVLSVESGSVDVDGLIDFLYKESVIPRDDIEGREAFKRQLELDRARLYQEDYKIRTFRLRVRLNDRILTGTTAGIDPETYERGQVAYGIHSPRHHRLIPMVDEVLLAVRNNFERARVCTQSEVLGNVVRSTWRGAPDRPMVVFPSEKPVTRANQLAWLGEGFITDHVHSLETDYLGDKGFVSYIALAVLPPKSIPTPGLEYLWLNDERGDPVDVIVHFQVLRSAEIRQTMDAKTSSIDEFAQRLAKRNGMAGQADIAAIRAATEEYNAWGKANKLAVRFTVTAAVTGRTQQIALATAKAIMAEGVNVDSGLEVLWAVPHGLELLLHQRCMPGSAQAFKFERYVHETEPLALAAGMPHATDIPSVRGSVMGRLTGRDRGPFLHSLDNVLLRSEDNGTVTACVGIPGQGKTTAMICYGITQAQKGGVVLLREGSKGDTRHLEGMPIPNLKSTVLMDISREPGGYNPAMWGEDRGERIASLADFLRMNAPYWDREFDGSLHVFCSDEIDKHPEEPDFRNVISALQQRRDLRRFGESLAPLADLTETDICRGTREQSNRLINRLERGRLTVWRSERWLLPDADKDPKTWTTHERFSVSCLLLQFRLSRQIAMQRTLRTFTADDEFHERAQIIGGSELGLHGRFGRSVGALYWVSTQGAGKVDIPKAFRDFATCVIAFRADTEATAKQYARLLRLEPKDPRVIRDIMTLGCDQETGLPVEALKGEAMIRYPNTQVIRAQYQRLQVGEAFITHADAYQH